MRPSVVTAVALLLVSCSSDLQVPPGAVVTCSAQAPACPADFACDVNLGLCLPTDLVVPEITVEQAVAHADALWVDTVDLTMRFTLPVGAAAPATMDIAGDVTTESRAAYAATARATLTPGDGEKRLQLSFADAAGSFAPSVVLILRVDTQAPINTVVIEPPALVTGEVALPDVYVNADNFSIPFASEPATLPDDFETYVYSVDGGATWTPTPAPLVLSPLAQDADTPVLVRERDIFGRMTAEDRQGVVTVHEDSQPPSAPKALVPTVLANVSSEAGVLVAPSVDPGGGLVRYEVIGGAYTEYTDVGTRPLIRFSGVPSGQLSVYLVHGVDRAGNTSPALSVPVGDTSMAPTGINRNSAQRSAFWGGNGFGAFIVKDNNTTNILEVCRLDGTGSLGCGQYDLGTTGTQPLLNNPSVYGRNVAFEDSTTATKPYLAFIDMGADGRLDFTPNDDGARTNLDFGHCPVAGPGAIAYGRWIAMYTYQPALYRYGADGIAATGDTGEGAVVISSNARVVQGNPCWMQFNGRQVVWADQRNPSSWILYDLGPDRVFGTADDTADQTLSDLNTEIVLGDRGLVRHRYRERTMQWVDFGPDGAYGTGDDATSTHPMDSMSSQGGANALAPAARDGKILGLIDGSYVLHDLGARTAVTLHSSLVGDGRLEAASLGAGMIFGALRIDSAIDNLNRLVPAYFQFAGEQLSYRFDSGTSRGGPSGTWAGDFALLNVTRLNALVFTNLTKGGTYFQSDPVVSSGDGFDISPEGLLVWIDNATRGLMLFSAGADQQPGTDDDLGPVEVPTGRHVFFPRVASGRIVWADLESDADRDWLGAGTLDSNLVVLDLGPDAWLSADDVPAVLTAAGSKAIQPSLAGSKLAYLDLTNDPNGSCESTRDGPNPTQCLSQLVAIDLVSGEKSTLSSAVAYRDSVRINADGSASWAQDRGDGTIDLRIWDGSERTVVAATDGRQPQLDGRHYAFLTPAGAVALDAGADGSLGTADDVTLRRGSGGAIGSTGSYWRWLGPEGMILGSAVLPLADDTQRYAGETALAVTDGGTLTTGITLPGTPGELVTEMTITMALTHASPTDLVITLTSPTGDVVPLRSHVAGIVVALTFDMKNTPALLDHWGEPIGGEWLLTVTDTANGTGGTLESWVIAHRS